MSGSAPVPLLRLDRVSRTFPGADPVLALRDVTLSVDRGEMLGIVGRSGSGKSTLLNVVGLLDRISAGTYAVDARSVGDLNDGELTRLRASFFGFVFQQSFLLSSYTAQENVELALRPHGLSRGDRRAIAAQALDEVGLAHRRRSMPATLSGGERQRVAIARAVAQRPRAILCDEPTGNLDEHTSSQILAMLLQLTTHGTTVVMVTHDLTIARQLPRVLTVRDGAVSPGLDSELLAGVGSQSNPDAKKDRQCGEWR
jgi:putative ABC transport system ATP-binding protein